MKTKSEGTEKGPLEVAKQGSISVPVCPFERPDKQCFQYLGPAAALEWKHNGLRHSFISYQLAQIKNVHQVSLEAGNNPTMVSKHYRQLVSETQASEWFGIVPPKNWKNIAPMPAEIPANQANEATQIRRFVDELEFEKIPDVERIETAI